MSVESLQSEIEFVLSNTGQPWEAASALITDFLRALHELMVKSGGDQQAILSQVQAVFGSTTMHHLAEVINARSTRFMWCNVVDEIPLHGITSLICKQRGFDPEDGRHLVVHFLKALDEERQDSAGKIESAPAMLYWCLSHEAAYHLVGLHVGDDRGIAATEICGYLDPSLRRFHKIVEMWELELEWNREAEK